MIPGADIVIALFIQVLVWLVVRTFRLLVRALRSDGWDSAADTL